MEERPPIWRVAANILNKQSRTAEKGWSSSFRVGGVLITTHRKNWHCYKSGGQPYDISDKSNNFVWQIR
jgi:hypothetical protein